jgi:uncharacterized protein (TIGR03435 family)
MKLDLARTPVVFMVFAVIAFGQPQTATPHREFEVASVKPNTSGPPSGPVQNPIVFLPGGRFTATNATLVDIITQVYQTRRIQMQGGPDWIDSEKFDIVAKADVADGEVTRAQSLSMAQDLLADRFKLVCHRENKEMPVLALVGPLPEEFHESKEGEPVAVPGERGKFTFKHWPMGGLVNLTSNVLRTPVIDGTGIKGYYDFSIDPMQFAESNSGSPPTYADLFEPALRELGFRLEKRKAPLEIFVIDQAVKPSAN